MSPEKHHSHSSLIFIDDKHPSIKPSAILIFIRTNFSSHLIFFAILRLDILHK